MQTHERSAYQSLLNERDDLRAQVRDLAKTVRALRRELAAARNAEPRKTVTA